MAEALTAQAILDTAEDVLRRYGPAKASVVDVARALDVSHGTVYRHFASKAALRDAVTQRWLDRVSAPLEQIVFGTGPATERLVTWVRTLAAGKQAMAAEDPELFATFQQLTGESREVVAAHIDHLLVQLARILDDGMARGEFAPGDAQATGWAVLQATARFHHPALAQEWDDPGIGDQLDAVLALLLRGLHPRA